MRKLAKTGTFMTVLAIIVLLLAAAISAGFSSTAGASESPTEKQPMLKLDITDGIRLARDCGVSGFHASLIRAFQTISPGDNRGGAGGESGAGGKGGGIGSSDASGACDTSHTIGSAIARNNSDAKVLERISKAFQQQIHTLSTMNNTALERGSSILDKQLLAIRAELEADAQNQLAVYEQYLDGQDEHEHKTFVSEQKLARERFHRILEAQYAPVLLNLQMQLYSISLTGRSEINTRVNMINDEIKELVAEREEQDRLDLEAFTSTQAVRRYERLAEKRLSLAGWVEEEFARLSVLLQDNLVHENSAKAQAIEAGINRRLEELGE